MPMKISASLSVDERSVLGRRTDAKPDPAYGMNERVGLLTVDLAADASDIHVDDVGRGVKMQIPYMLQQHRPGHDLVGVADQVFEDLEFARQQLKLAAAAMRGPGHEVHLEIADAQDGLLDDGGGAPRQRLDARQQLGERERLDQVVVAAGAQTAHAVVDLAKRADDERGRDDSGFAHAPDDRDSV